ncbi:hypothetical protein PISMIDRAFT_98488, partial [Pisolithus microcarpus 441]
VPFGVTYVKIGTIQRRLAWPLHKDDTLFRSGRPTGLNIYFPFFSTAYHTYMRTHLALVLIDRSIIYPFGNGALTDSYLNPY